MKSLKTTIISLVLTFSILFSSLVPVSATTICSHNLYGDTYVTSEYTGNYTSSQHQVLHYYKRVCKGCGQKIGEPTETVWANHSIKNNKCECGYTVESCKHADYTDTYVTSTYTGKYTTTQHETTHYYKRICKACNQKIGEPTETIWANHSIKNNKCECGYTVESCKHADYTDTYVTSTYTGKYTTTQHETTHYYKRICKACNQKIGEPTETIWANHSIKNNKCECGYTVESCKHADYTDTYVTSEYTCKYTTTQHETTHYYKRICSYCAKKIGEPTETVWANHSIKNNKCECGYTVESCKHADYTDTYVTSTYTGKYTTTQHETTHYYKRICKACNQKIGEPTETVWGKHFAKNHKCECGYVESSAQESVISDVTVKFNVDIENRIEQLNTLINETIPKAYNNGKITLEKRDKLLKSTKDLLNEYSEVKSGKRLLKNVTELQEKYLAKNGSESPVVFQIQKQLVTLGYTSQTETGIYDDITYNNVLYFQLINDLNLSGWLDETTVTLINLQSKQKIENYEKLYGELTNLKNTRYDVKKEYKLKIECNSVVKKAYIQFLNPRDSNKIVGGQQFEVDLKTGIAMISVDAKCTYDCYLFLVGENNETSKVYQGIIEFCDLAPGSVMSKANFVIGIKDAFVDATGGILSVARIAVNSSWQGAKNKFYQITNQQEKIQATQIQQLLSFIAKAMIPNSEENKLLDQMIEQTFGDLLYEALNSTTEEKQRAVGYVIGDILFGYLLTAGVTKAADKVGDFSKAAKGAIEIADGTVNVKGQYVDDIAKYADEIAEAADDLSDIAKHLDDYKVIANKFPDEALPTDGRIYSTVIRDGKISGLYGLRDVDFVVTKDGRLIVGKRHAFLAEGEDVIAAGELRLSGHGEVLNISNLSGHYQPTLEQAAQFENIFSDLGLDLTRTWKRYYTFDNIQSNYVGDYHLVIHEKIVK